MTCDRISQTATLKNGKWKEKMPFPDQLKNMTFLQDFKQLQEHSFTWRRLPSKFQAAVKVRNLGQLQHCSKKYVLFLIAEFQVK